MFKHLKRENMPENQVKIGNIPLNTGIARNNPYGGMEDVMNCRYIDGALKPVQKGRRLGPAPDYDNFIVHPASGINHWIGYKAPVIETGTPGYIDEFKQTDSNGVTISTTVTTIITLVPSESIIDLKPFKNFIIFTTNLRMYKYLYYDSVYVPVDITRQIQVTLNTTDEKWCICDGPEHEGTLHDRSYTDNDYSCADELKGWIYEKLSDESADNAMIAGAISWVAAYKLTDGTYMMQTTPQIQQSYVIPEYNEIGSSDVDFGLLYYSQTAKMSPGVDSWLFHDVTSAAGGKVVIFLANKWEATLSPAYYADMVNEEKIISSICIFFSKPTLKYDIEKTVDDTNDFDDTTNNFINFNSFNKITDDWDNIGSPELGWFLVAEIPFLTLIESEETTFSAEKYMDLDNFYSNYATREALPVDQYTHHSLDAENIFIYNSRLWLTEVTKTLAIPQPLTMMMTEATLPLTVLRAKLVVRLNIDSQKKVVVSDEFDLNAIIDDSSMALIHFPIIAYPDDRANEFSIYVFHSGVWKEYCTYPLEKSSTHNFSYYLPLVDTSILSNILWFRKYGLDDLSIVDDPILQLSNIDDSLRSQVQLSALNNPFVYPSSLNYTVGNGSVNWMAVALDEMGLGLFGQFPVVCFCSDGVFALTVGTGDIVVSATTPVALDIAIGSPTGTSLGIFFPSKNGIMVLEGRKVTDISIPLRGKIGVIVSGEDKYFALYSNHNQVCNLDTLITTLTEFKDDLTGMILAYDHEWKRIFATKPGLGYSYVFDILTNTWYRVSEDYTYFATGIGISYAVNDRGLIDLTDLTDNTQDSSTIEVHWHTKPMTFNTNHRKKLEETLLKCMLKTNTSNYASFCIFASNDGEKWYMITANDRKNREINDIQLTFTFASYKYFVFAFWGRLRAEYDNYFDSIDCEVKERYGHRLRSY
jgi:hypothetical protein